MDKVNFTFEIVVLLFKDGQIRKISKTVTSIYMDTYREVGYAYAEELIAQGWRVYSISIENILIENRLVAVNF